MRPKLMTLFGIAAAMLVVAACGSSKKSSSSTASVRTPHAAQHHKTHKHKTNPNAVPSRTYNLKLVGKNEIPQGAPKGSADAVVTLRGKSHEVCYSFTRLTGFSSPTFAHIHQGGAGIAGNIVVPLSTGAKFKPSGCVGASATLIKAIAGNPHVYYVNIHNKKYPAGAVRAQL